LESIALYPAPVRTQSAVSAGGVIVDDGGRVVLTARRSFSGALQWGLPKGLVEPGEELAHAALREAEEETGLRVEIVSRLPTIDYWYVDTRRSVRVHKHVHWYLMRPTGGDPTAHDAETEEVVALPPDEAVARASFRSERGVIQVAVEAWGSRPGDAGEARSGDRGPVLGRNPPTGDPPGRTG
jgi:8-oxo-dGTP pyrophosphatase MutT (NUDIX family)